MNQHSTDANLTAKDVSRLTSPEAVAALLTSLGYDTDTRKRLSPEAIGLAGESAAAVVGIEVLSEDPDGFLRVVFVHLRSLTARARNDLARGLGRTNVDHLLILTSDFSVIEFVLLDKRKRDARGPGGVPRIQVVPLSVTVDRKAVATEGEPIYLRVNKYLQGKGPDTKSWHHKQRRVGLQESCPQNNFRRIIAASIPAGEFCNHRINCFPEHSSAYPLTLLLAILNSRLAD